MTTPASFVLAARDAGIGDALAQLVSYLQLPVLLCAIGMLLLTCIEVGRFLVELWRRFATGRHRELTGLTRAAISAPGQAAALASGAPSGAASAAVRALASATTPAASEAALTDFEHAVQRRLDRTRLLVRGGPAFGLMGTLIPLAPGLQALGEGNVPALADELRTAFAATVIGILVGAVAFALTLTRQRFASEDLTALERALAAPDRTPA